MNPKNIQIKVTVSQVETVKGIKTHIVKKLLSTDMPIQQLQGYVDVQTKIAIKQALVKMSLFK
jgi:hypothetical protein